MLKSVAVVSLAVALAQSPPWIKIETFDAPSCGGSVVTTYNEQSEVLLLASGKWVRGEPAAAL